MGCAELDLVVASSVYRHSHFTASSHNLWGRSSVSCWNSSLTSAAALCSELAGGSASVVASSVGHIIRFPPFPSPCVMSPGRAASGNAAESWLVDYVCGIGCVIICCTIIRCQPLWGRSFCWEQNVFQNRWESMLVSATHGHLSMAIGTLRSRTALVLAEESAHTFADFSKPPLHSEVHSSTAPVSPQQQQDC
jgi:hypothetical protein